MSIHRRLRRRQAARGIVLSSFGVIGAVAAPQFATAQNAPPPSQTEEIIVTGSRVFQSGFDSAQPLTTIDSEQIQNLGIVNTGDIVRTLPQNTPFFTETNVGFGNFNVGSQLANLRGLNPFFGSRTLTLVDTRRVVPTTEGGAVDLTLIPSMLVGRTEVVTGGASAQYGSDAIAGVVNVILDKTLDGIKAQVDAGETAESDGGDTHASFAFGTGFGNNDKGHLLVGAEYQKQDIIGPCSKTRDWCKEAWGAFTNAQFAAGGVGNGLPNFMVLPNGKFPTSNTGVFTSGGVTRQFNENGTDLVAYDPGRFPGAFSRQGGDGTLLAYDLSSIRPETERYSLLGHVDLDLTSTLRFDAEIGYAHSDAENNPANGALGPFGAGTAIAADNAFLTPAVRALAPAGGTLQRVFLPDIVSARNTTENTTTRLVAGLNGDLGEKWSWDVYYQHGENENHQRLFHNAVGLTPGPFQYMLWALDAVHTNPADLSSPIVCRAVLQGIPNAAGCVPLNIFGNGNASPAAIEYAFRTLKEDTEYKQDVVGANFRTTLAEGWAGPINFATGLEWRKDKEDATHDIPNQPWYSGYFLSYGLDRGGDIEVTEAYGEVNVPMSKKLVTDFSARWTQNEATSHTGNAPGSSHDFNSWKATAFYDALDWLRFRATVSQDVRAAGFRELFLPRVETIAAGFPAPVNNPWSGVQDVYLNISGGNSDLKPETADTKTIGMVLSFERFHFSIDRFEIDLKDAITPGGAGGIGAQQLVQACFASGGVGAVCDKIGGVRGANNAIADISSVDTRSINIGKFLTKGYDLEATYNWSLSRGGDLQLRMIGTYLPDMIIDTGLGSPAVNYHGQSGPVASFGGFNTSPDWQARAFVTWAKDKLTTTFETRYISSGKLNATWTESAPGTAGNRTALTVNDNSVDDAYYLAWSGSWDFTKSSEGRGTQLFWAVNNLFDKDPPVAPGGNVYPTNPVFFDTLGLRYRVGVRFAF